jgi:hypothetical protein
VAVTLFGPFTIPAAADAPSAPAKRSASCSFGSADHELSVQVTDLKVVTRLQRQGDALVLREGSSPLACAGPTPTIHNVDTVSVFSRTEFDVDLRNGPFAPGFTDERDGSSEIEIVATFSRTGGLRVRGSAGNDRITMGDLGPVDGLDLNAREHQPDADVTVSGGFNVISVLGRGGNDKISARGGRGFKAPLDTKVAVSAGRGHDRVIGSALSDLLGGGSDADFVKGGKGRDRIRTQGGSDKLRVRDHERDHVSCGPGHDKVKADRIDRLGGCDLH